MNVSNYLNRTDEELNYFYRLSTKLREGNVFIAVCLSTGVSLILYSFGGMGIPGTRSLPQVQGVYIWGGGYLQGVSTHPPDMGPQEGRYVQGNGYSSPPRTWDVRGVSNHCLRHGIRLDMVSKQALCILLECFVVGHHFTNNSVREIKIWFRHLGSLQSNEPLKIIFGSHFVVHTF